MGFFSDLFGGKRKEALIEALGNGAKVIDVRTVAEFKSGNVAGSVNVPLNQFNNKTIKRIKKLNKPVVVCCATGSRSSVAKRMLEDAGIETYNGKAWYKVHRLLAVS